MNAAATYYWETSYHEEKWKNADGSYTTEHYPYCEIREKPNADSTMSSHMIGEAVSEGWADYIVAALNGLPDQWRKDPSAAIARLRAQRLGEGVLDRAAQDPDFREGQEG